MKLSQSILFLLTFITALHAFAIPDSFNALADSAKQLAKRRGGGGGRGGGRSGGGRSGGSSSPPASTRPNSIVGGTTSAGSGPQPRLYSGGRTYYPGGAPVPYRSGAKSPGGITPRFLPAAGLGFFPGIWLYGAYAYPYHGYYLYHNQTSNRNESRPVECLCGRYAECGCDANNQTDYVTSVANNNSIARVGNVDGQQKLVINGTLPNGTTAASAAPALRQSAAGLAGWSLVVVGVIYTTWFF